MGHYTSLIAPDCLVATQEPNHSVVDDKELYYIRV